MKIIISHDVDYIKTTEHFHDLLIVKKIVRNLIECALGYATSREVLLRFKSIVMNQLHNLDELIAFDRKNHIPSTFFFGTGNGLYLNYSHKEAAYWIEKVRSAGLSVGVHGIQYNDKSSMQKEHDHFRAITGLTEFGIRMHYLRMSDCTLDHLGGCGYVFDSSKEILAPPYKKAQIWEFPLHIMDSRLFFGNGRWLDHTFEQAKDLTISLFKQAEELGITHFTILLHDPFFCEAYNNIKKWYIWLVKYSETNRYELVDYQNAIIEIERTST